MLDPEAESFSTPAEISAPPRTRSSGFQILFYALGVIGTGLGCLASEQRLLFIWIAWCIAGATTFTLWIGVGTVRHLLNDASHNEWRGESWLPLRGRWLRLFVYTPLLVPGLVFLWSYSMLVLTGIGLILARMVWP